MDAVKISALLKDPPLMTLPYTKCISWKQSNLIYVKIWIETMLYIYWSLLPFLILQVMQASQKVRQRIVKKVSKEINKKV